MTVTGRIVLASADALNHARPSRGLIGLMVGAMQKIRSYLETLSPYVVSDIRDELELGGLYLRRDQSLLGCLAR